MDRIKELEAENARLTAQLAAIQGGMGEVVEVAATYCADMMRAVPSGLTHLRDKEQLVTLAQHQRITAAMAAEVERLNLLIDVGAKLHLDAAYGEIDLLEKERDALRAELAGVKQASLELADSIGRRHDVVTQLRAELAEVKGREAVSDADIEAAFARAGGRWDGDKWAIEDADLHPFARSIATPPASPDVEGLVKALEDCAGRLRLLIDSRRHKMLDVVAEEKARAALSTWRQAHTPSTLPASSAEE